MEVTYTLQEADYRCFYKYLFNRQVPIAVQVGIPLLLLLPAVYVLLKGGNPISSPISVTALFLILALWLGRREALRLPARNAQVGGQRTLRISAAGVQQETAEGSEDTPWPDIVDVVRVPDYIYLFVSKQVAFVVPLRALGEQGAAEFHTLVQKFWQTGK